MSELSIAGYDGFRLLGRGGFSAVYQARQVEYDRQVAVKILDVAIHDDHMRKQVLRERAATGRLTGHPNIVTVLDSGFVADGRPYLAMALCPGGSYADKVAREGALPVPEVLRVGVKIAGALETAHRNGIVHRDVKPENMLIGAYGEPALADFGISTMVDHRSLTRNTQAYTANHAPPEVLRGESATVRSDIYNFGSSLYQLLTGQPPFAVSGSTGLALFVDRVLNQPPPVPGRADVPASLTALLHKALAKSPADRFETAAQMGAALQQVQRELGQHVEGLTVGEGDLAAFNPRSMAAGAVPHTGSTGSTPPRRPDPTIRPPAPVAGRPAAGAFTAAVSADAPAGAGAPTVLPPRPQTAFAVGAAAGDQTVLGAARPGIPTPPAETPAAPAERRRWLIPVLAAVLVLALLAGIGWTVLRSGTGSDSSSGRSDPQAGAQTLGATPDSTVAGTGSGTTSAQAGTAQTTPVVEATTPHAKATTRTAVATGAATTARATEAPFATLQVTADVDCMNGIAGFVGALTIKWSSLNADTVQLTYTLPADPSGDADLNNGSGPLPPSGQDSFSVKCDLGADFVVTATPRRGSVAGPPKKYTRSWNS